MTLIWALLGIICAVGFLGIAIAIWLNYEISKTDRET